MPLARRNEIGPPTGRGSPVDHPERQARPGRHEHAIGLHVDGTRGCAPTVIVATTWGIRALSAYTVSRCGPWPTTEPAHGRRYSTGRLSSTCAPGARTVRRAAIARKARARDASASTRTSAFRPIPRRRLPLTSRWRASASSATSRSDVPTPSSRQPRPARQAFDDHSQPHEWVVAAVRQAIPRDASDELSCGTHEVRERIQKSRP